MEELIVIKQLPIIEENLKELSGEIDKKIENANALVCNDETVKEVKKLRAELNKEFKELETQRKFVKTEIEKPYKEFEEIYAKYISTKYKQADTTLSNKIHEVESELKNEKEVQVREYFEELLLDKKIDFLTFADTDIVVTLSASLKSLKEQVKTFLEKVEQDLKTIKTQTYADEIEVEYRKNLNLNQSIQEVTNRHLVLENLKKSEEQITIKNQEEEKTIELVEEVLQAPIEENVEFEEVEEILETTFTVRGTLRQLQEVKEFLEKGGYVYE